MINKKIEFVSTLLGLVALLLTVVSGITDLIPDLAMHTTLLLILSTLFFMLLSGYISWAKKQGQFSKVFMYSGKTRTLSKVAFIIIPLTSIFIWYTAFRLTTADINRRDTLIKLGNSYYDKKHTKELALDPYRKAIKIDPRQPEIIKRIKDLEQ